MKKTCEKKLGSKILSYHNTNEKVLIPYGLLQDWESCPCERHYPSCFVSNNEQGSTKRSVAITCLLTMSQLSIKTRHSFLLPIGDHEQHQRLAFIHVRTIDPIESPPFQLNNILLFQCFQTRISDYLGFGLGVRIDEVLKLIVFLKFFFRDEIVKLRENYGNVFRNVSEP
mmetsp:Transcript_5814/g.12137  ORF Transcript_5814/g.12137 Transcript_5814/m.12137 type:complete len:170 (-) Transcript_5814:2113-2622(-)